MVTIVDISHHQGKINFKKFAEKVDLAIIRVQYGSRVQDRMYKEYVKGCKAHGVPFGQYAYALFVSESDAKQEAKDFLARADTKAKFLVVDVEEQTTKTKGEMLKATQAFIDYIKEHDPQKRKVGLYTGHHFYNPYNMDKVKADFLWIPRYSGTNKPGLKPIMSCDLWQYTDKGKVPGVSGNIDMNLLQGKKGLSWYLSNSQQAAATTQKYFTSGSGKYEVKENCYAYKGVKYEETERIKLLKKGTILNVIEIVKYKTYYRLKVRLDNKIVYVTANKDFVKKYVSNTTKQYKVKYGDTLGDIANKHNTTVSKLKALNHIKNVNAIYAGQTLKIK